MLEKLQKRPSETAAQHAKLALITDDVPEIADAAAHFFQTLANLLEAVIVSFFACRGNNFILLALAAHVTSKPASNLYLLNASYLFFKS